MAAALPLMMYGKFNPWEVVQEISLNKSCSAHLPIVTWRIFIRVYRETPSSS